MQEFELRRGRQPEKHASLSGIRLLSLRVAFFFLKVASWLRKYPHTGVEINHACHPHAAQQSDPCFGVLWRQYGHVYPPCLVFSSEFSLSTQNALNNQTLQTILQSQALRDLSFGTQERPNMSQLR